MKKEEIIYKYEMESNPTGAAGDPKNDLIIMLVLLIVCIIFGSIFTDFT